MYKIVIIILITILIQFDVFPAELHNDTNINNNTHTKIVLIGFDGLEWSIIEELIKEGKMPTFARLIQDGVCGNLRIFDKASSPMLWTSLATGKGPELHGIHGHVIYEDNKYEPVPPRSYHRKVKALWNMLSDNGKKVGVIKYFATWPSEEIYGFIVPDTSRFSNLDDIDVFPNNLDNELNSIIKSYNIKYSETKDFFEKEANYINVNLDTLSAITKYLYLKFNKNLDLLMVYTRETDFAQHWFWKFMEPEYFQHPVWGLNSENIKKYGSYIKDMYQKVDEMVKEIIKYIDGNTIVIICSDHGFQRRPNLVVCLDKLNKLLEVIGFLAFRDDVRTQNIDFSKTKAYHHPVEFERPPYALISINTKGRKPQGIVEPGEEYSRVKRRLIDILSKLKVVETNEKLFNNVSEVSIEEADITVSIKENIDLLQQHVKIKGRTYPLNTFYTFYDFSGDHKNHKGVLIICGKNIEKGKLIDDAHICDVTPTILYLLGLPTATDMQGQVLMRAIKEDFLKANPIKYISTYESKETKNEEPYSKSASEPIDSQQLEKLKSLGYVQ